MKKVRKSANGKLRKWEKTEHFFKFLCRPSQLMMISGAWEKSKPVEKGEIFTDKNTTSFPGKSPGNEVDKNIYSFLFIYLFIYSFILSFVYLYLYLFIYVLLNKK